MKFEHVAINVKDACAVASWYVEHIGLNILKAGTAPNYGHFLADSDGRIFFELYSQASADVPDYASMNSLVLHLAFVSTDAESDLQRLLVAGATLLTDETTPDGSRLLMMRDPWGLAIQFCQRANPYLV